MLSFCTDENSAVAIMSCFKQYVTIGIFSSTEQLLLKRLWDVLHYKDPKPKKGSAPLFSSATTLTCTVAMTSETWRDFVAMTAGQLGRNKMGKSAYKKAIKARKPSTWSVLTGENEQNNTIHAIHLYHTWLFCHPDMVIFLGSRDIHENNKYIPIGPLFLWFKTC